MCWPNKSTGSPDKYKENIPRMNLKINQIKYHFLNISNVLPASEYLTDSQWLHSIGRKIIAWTLLIKFCDTTQTHQSQPILVKGAPDRHQLAHVIISFKDILVWCGLYCCCHCPPTTNTDIRVCSQHTGSRCNADSTMTKYHTKHIMHHVFLLTAKYFKQILFNIVW